MELTEIIKGVAKGGIVLSYAGMAYGILNSMNAGINDQTFIVGFISAISLIECKKAEYLSNLWPEKG